jgi:hypothetical protein
MKTQFAKPEPGCKVAITFVHDSYVIGHPGPVSTVLTGMIDQPTRVTPQNFIRLILDTDSYVPVREIALERVVAIEYADGTATTQELLVNDTQTWTVDGSRGSRYTVVRTKNKWSCTCSGFQFRKTCKHVKEQQHA